MNARDALAAATRPHCPDCASADLRAVGALPEPRIFAGRPLTEPLDAGTLFDCRGCGLKFRFPVLPKAVYDRLYDNGAVGSWSPSLRADQRLAQAYLETHCRHAKVLDYGCYTGQFLGGLSGGIQRYGVEVNDAAADEARRHAGARVWRDLDAIDDGMRFDVIVCMDVIEHFHSPLVLVRQLLTRLEPGGLLLITTGDADAPLWQRVGSRWWYCSYPEHLSFVSRRWLAHHAAGLGVTLADCQSFNYKDESAFKRLLRWLLFGSAMAASSLAAVAATMRFGRGARAEPSVRALPGVGLGPDHLFIVLRKRQSDQPEVQAR